jgi:lipopolysaccharide transport system ATP-binding protein
MTPMPMGGIKSILFHLPQYVRALSQRKQFRALDGVTFQVRRGECFGIIGRNGSGKSTSLGLIAGVIKPTSGVIDVERPICALLELGAGFHRELTGRDNIILNGVLLGMRRREVGQRMAAIIEFSGLREFVDQPIRSYSSGMLARLGFSVAVHVDLRVLLVDEVLAVGDEGFQAKCLERIGQFRAAGKTIVFVSHDLVAIRKTCDRVAILDAGRLLADGPPDRIISQYTQMLHE